MINKFHKVHSFLTQANMMCNITALCSSSVCSFTALILQEAMLCVRQYTATRDRQEVAIYLSAVLQNRIHSVQKANFSIHSITGHHLAPFPGLGKARNESLVWYKLLLP